MTTSASRWPAFRPVPSWPPRTPFAVSSTTSTPAGCARSEPSLLGPAAGDGSGGRANPRRQLTRPGEAGGDVRRDQRRDDLDDGREDKIDEDFHGIASAWGRASAGAGAPVNE